MKRDELTRGLTQDHAAVEVHGEEHADVAHPERDPVKHGPDGVFLDARTVVERDQEWRQEPAAIAQGLRQCSVEESGVLPAEAIDGTQGLAKRRCRKDRHQPKRDPSRDIKRRRRLTGKAPAREPLPSECSARGFEAPPPRDGNTPGGSGDHTRAISDGPLRGRRP